ncbi:MAG: DUF3604 domain-containing protein [Halieaceae bacterium]|jgi:hypothetical protein|nr:DUF3604 domain-containing protein [Halieaceae bacterium]
MVKRVLLVLILFIALSLLWFHAIGTGWLGEPWQPASVAQGPRPLTMAPGGPAPRQPQILFGDLHNHTNYSIDAYLFNSGAVKNVGVVTPADACDFARYCSALDFWSINDHAEGLTPRVWADTLRSIRQCNDRAGDPDNPDMVSYVGWEWSNSERDDVPSHYGHKNVIFRTWEEGSTPTRPIASLDQYELARVPAFLMGLISLVDSVAAASDFGWYLEESRTTATCPDDVPADELSLDCREVALDPLTLYRKLDEWGFDSIVIPHGLAWGTTNPPQGDFREQLDQHQQRYQKLLEVYSGHGNSELFIDFERIGRNAQGGAYCPQATEHFTPCCRQAGNITRKRCQVPGSTACEAEVEEAMADFVAVGGFRGRMMFSGLSVGEWEGCGQLQGTFQPSSAYVTRLSGQYNLALGFDRDGAPKRARFGLIGSSDGHQARPGSSYKESNRPRITDHKGAGRMGISPTFYRPDKESGGFYYSGGLVAAHTRGRDRDAIWSALDTRNVYATSGDRMLVWFDLLNGPTGESPMGTEVRQVETPRFRVKALGAFEQQPGCPDYAEAALGADRLQSLCGGECYHPGGNRRKAITRIEIVRIRPQIYPQEKIAPLVEDSWRVFECPADGTGCSVEFEDPQYSKSARSALYYARVIQEAEPLVVGDPFGCEYDEEGNCISRTYCIGANASSDNDCLSDAEPRAWISPIFLEYPPQ